MHRALHVLLVVAALAGCAAALAVRPPARGASEIYVSPQGVDSEAHGSSPTNPVQTVGYAASRLAAGGVIRVLPGSYAGAKNFPTFKQDVSVVGYPDGSHPERHVFSGQGKHDLVGFGTDGNITVEFQGLLVEDFLESCMEPECNFAGINAMTRGCNVHISNCVFRGNNRAVMPLLGTTTIVNSTFEDNSIAVALRYSDFASTATLRMSNCTLRSTGDAPAGVGIDVSRPADIEADTLLMEGLLTAMSLTQSRYAFNVTLSSSRILNGGRGIYAYGQEESTPGVIRLSSTTFDSLSSTSTNGGGLYIGRNIDVSADGCIFSNIDISGSSSAYGRGSAVYCENEGSISLSNCLVEDNKATEGHHGGYCEKNCAASAFDTTARLNTEEKDTSPCHGL